jgi:hypothetical protein
MKTLKESILAQDHDISDDAVAANALWKDIAVYGWTIGNLPSLAHTTGDHGILDGEGIIVDIYAKILKYVTKRRPRKDEHMVEARYYKYSNCIALFNKGGISLKFYAGKDWQAIVECDTIEKLNSEWKLIGYLPVEVIDVIMNAIGLRRGRFAR